MEQRDANLTPQDIERMRDVFLGSPKGRDVLKTLLGDMGFFSQVETERTQILKNYATRLVQLLGPQDSDLLASNIINSIHTSWKFESKQFENKQAGRK